MSQEKKNLSIIDVASSEVKDIQAFCKLNNVEDVGGFMKQCFQRGYNLEKYGLLDEKGQPKVIEKEVEKIVFKEVEKIVEVPSIEYVEIEKVVVKEIPVEKIVEVEREVIKEIPVERVVTKEIIKEVPVERVVVKEVYVSDDTQLNELLSKIQQLENERQLFSTKEGNLERKVQEFSTKMEEMENIFQEESIRYDTQISDLIRKIDELENRPPLEVEIIKEIEVIKEVEKIVDGNPEKLQKLQKTIENLLTQQREKDKEIAKYKEIMADLDKQFGRQSASYLKSTNLKDEL